ncbi:MAG TPA: hypothetical protein VGQ21_14160 [Thermoanaerobaculia bacterium]|jgi:hypothetical protein|nr:hypothetical protein [Thermoanaerobaculia bacterium]
MSKISTFPAAANLNRRETIEIELPSFLVRALQEHVRAANEDADEEERVDLNHLIEVQLAECVTIADVARMERDVPGMSKAVSRWLTEIEHGDD